MEPQAKALREQIRTLVRQLGVLSTTQTPCGADIGVSHAHALIVLHEEGGPLKQRDLAARLNLDKSSVTRLVRRMQKDAHVQMCENPEDARVRAVCLSPQGRALASRLQQESAKRFASVLDHLAPEQRQPVLESLAALNQALAAMERDAAR